MFLATKQTIDDRLGAHCDVAEEDETAELDSVIFVRVFFSCCSPT
jgi:hypothetical protein